MPQECHIIELGPCGISLYFGTLIRTRSLTGAGTGIVSLVLAALRASDTACVAHKTRIFSTDLREQDPFVLFVLLRLDAPWS